MMYGWKKHRMETWRTYFFRLLFKEQYRSLCWYADEHHYQAIHAKEQMVLIMVDHGENARKALGRDWE